MSLLLGLIGLCTALIFTIVGLIRHLSDIQAEKKQSEAALHAVNKANAAVSSVIKEQEITQNETENSITERHYFGD